MVIVNTYPVVVNFLRQSRLEQLQIESRVPIKSGAFCLFILSTTTDIMFLKQYTHVLQAVQLYVAGST